MVKVFYNSLLSSFCVVDTVVDKASSNSFFLDLFPPLLLVLCFARCIKIGRMTTTQRTNMADRDRVKKNRKSPFVSLFQSLEEGREERETMELELNVYKKKKKKEILLPCTEVCVW